MAVHLNSSILNCSQVQSPHAIPAKPPFPYGIGSASSDLVSSREKVHANESSFLCSCFESLINWLQTFFSNMFSPSPTPVVEENPKPQQGSPKRGGISPVENKQQIADSIGRIEELKNLIANDSNIDQVRQYFRTQLSESDQNEIKSWMTFFGSMTGIALNSDFQTRMNWAERIIEGQVQVEGETRSRVDIENHVDILANRSLFRNSIDRVLLSLKSDLSPNQTSPPPSYRGSPA